MFMEANEPFQRVNSATSPMVGGLMGALAVGGAASIAPGLQYASYRGLENHFADKQEKVKTLEGRLQQTAQYETKTPSKKAQRQLHKADKELFNTFQQHEELRWTKEKLEKGGYATAREDKVAAKFKNNEPMSRKEVYVLQKANQQRQQTLERINTAIPSHAAKLEELKHKRLNMAEKAAGGPQETKAYRKLNEDVSKMKERYSNESLLSKKESYLWHGKNAKSVGKTVGKFAAGGFVAGAILQTTANKYNNA